MTRLHRLVFAAVLLSLSASFATSVHGTRMFDGDRLYYPDTLYTDQGAYYLEMRFGGQSSCGSFYYVAWRYAAGAFVWNSGIDGTFTGGYGNHQNQYACDGRTLHMQSDGNLVLYNPSETVDAWSTQTGSPGSSFSLQDDGNLVIYSASEVPLWSIF